MGLNVRHSYGDYWSLNPLLGAPAVVEAFPINRYSHIFSHLYFNDSQTFIPRGQPEHDRLHKICPILDKLSQKFLSLCNPHRQNPVDEAMIRFKGRSSPKQYMPKNQLNVDIKFGADVTELTVTHAISKYMWEKKVLQSKDWAVG